MILLIRSLLVPTLLTLCFCGCGSQKTDSPAGPPGVSPTEASPPEQEQTRAVVADLQTESQNAEPIEPSVTLPTLPGWTKSEPRPLPLADHGFSVAYDHEETGLTVTLYQFTRGLSSIPNDVNSAIVKEEMKGARYGIEQAVKFGIWEAAKETKSETIQLGDSQQQALWSQYELTVDGAKVASDIYVWAQANKLFKIRSTSQSKDAKSDQATLVPLLTALGSSGAAAKE